MRDRVPLLVVLASALAFLVSLFLPWQEAGQSGVTLGGDVGVLGLTNVLGASSSDGWTTEAGVAASLAALILVATTAVALVRPGAVGRLVALFPFALALLYLAIADLVVLHAEEELVGTIQANRTAHYHYTYGAYLGVAAAAIAVLAAAFLERTRLARRPSGVELVTILLGVGLLVAILLPWTSSQVSFPGIDGAPVVLAAIGVCLLVGGLLRSRIAVYVAGMIAVLVGATVNEVASEPRIGYGAWTALGLALAFVVATAFLRPPARPATPSLSGALAAAAAAVYAIALFLPWRQYCAPGGQRLGGGLGRCYVSTGWGAGESSAAAGTLALIVIVAAVVLAWSTVATAELTLAIAIFTAVSGVALENQGGPEPGWSTRYGAYAGFAAAGILLVVGLVRLRLPRLESRRVIDRLVPVAASIACLCAIALPVWSALPDRWSPSVEVLGGWYAVVGVLLALHLLRRWLDFVGGPAAHAEELVLLPLGVLALTGLALIHERGNGMTWGGGILVALCIVLTLFGCIEQRGGLEGLRVPEALRVDRLPEAES
jgi:hypothetical protein